MISDVHVWPIERLGEAVERIARFCGVECDILPTSLPKEALESKHDRLLKDWVDWAARRVGLEAVLVEAKYEEADSIRSAAPAIVPVNRGDNFVVVLGNRWGRVRVLGPDLNTRMIAREDLVHALVGTAESRVAPQIDQVLDQASVRGLRRARARAKLMQDYLSAGPCFNGWLFRLPPGASFWKQARLARIDSRVIGFVAAYFTNYLLTLAAWALLGSSALEGRFDRGRLLGWMLLLVSSVPVQLIAGMLEGLFSIRLSSLLQGRLLLGALRMDPDEVRGEGIGHVIGRVSESEAIGSLALNAGLGGVLALIDVALVAGILLSGQAGVIHLALYVVWLGVSLWLGARWVRSYRTWTQSRLAMTHDLVEKMVGHRTRIVQDVAERWHEGEDGGLEAYHEQSKQLDTRTIHFGSIVPRGWLLVGVAGLIPAFVWQGTTAGGIAVALGGVILGSRALSSIMGALSAFAGAVVAWKQAGPLFRSATREEDREAPDDTHLRLTAAPPSVGKQTILRGKAITYRYGANPRQVLRGCDVRIDAGDRILLLGPSGGGKSTLAAVLAGLRVPESGVLLLRGLDRQTLGLQAWRKRVAVAPQFQENHILTGTLAYNLLLGRSWPPSEHDMSEAEELCNELGLGELLTRMPSGMLQVVGETGWRLSHGEQSRVFLARALLQKADVVILDESFGALDPDTMERCLDCALKRAPTLVAIAHP